MTTQDKWVENLVELSRQSAETGLKSLERLQDQADQVVEMTINNINVMQSETTKALQTMLDSAREARQLYNTTIEDGLRTIQENAAPAKGKKSKQA